MGLFFQRVFQLPAEQFCMPWTAGRIAKGCRCLILRQGHVIKVFHPGEQPDKKVLRQPETRLVVVSIAPMELYFSFANELTELAVKLNVSLDAVEQMGTAQAQLSFYQQLAGFLWQHAELNVADLKHLLAPIVRSVLACAMSEEEFIKAFSLQLWQLAGMSAHHCQLIDLASQGNNLAETLLEKTMEQDAPISSTLEVVPYSDTTEHLLFNSESRPLKQANTVQTANTIQTANKAIQEDALGLKTKLLHELRILLVRIPQGRTHSEIRLLQNTLRQCQTKLGYFTPSSKKDEIQQIEALERTLYYCHQLQQELNEEAPLPSLTHCIQQINQSCYELFP